MDSTPAMAGQYPPRTLPSITTFGNGAIGLYASGSGSTSASDGPSTITADGASIVTHGVSAPGVQADTGGLVTLNGGAVMTTGIDSHAVFVTGAGSMATLNGTNVLTTSGDGAIGLYRPGRRRHRRDWADRPFRPETSRPRRASVAFGVNCRRRRFENRPCCDDSHNGRDERFRILRQQWRDDRCAGCAEASLHPGSGRSGFMLPAAGRASPPTALRLSLRFLSAGRAGRCRRARDAERRRGDDDEHRRARRISERRRIAGDAQRHERSDHQWRSRDRTLRSGRRRHRCDRTDSHLDRKHFELDGPRRLRGVCRWRGFANQSRGDHGHDVGDERLWVSTPTAAGVSPRRTRRA